MRKQMIIRWMPDAGGPVAAGARADWVLREPGRTAVLHSGALQEAAAQAAGAQVSVLVPGVAVLLAAAELPPLKGARLLRAAPYALEDQLAADVEQVHVACGGRDAEGRLANAVVARETLDSWLGELRAAGLHADVVSPELFGIAWEQQADTAGWALVLDGAQALLRTGAQAGLAFDTDNLPALLRAALDGAGERKPAHLTVTACESPQFYQSEGYREVAGLCSQHGIRLQQQPVAASCSTLLAQGFDPRLAINLLQGDYSTRAQLGKFLRPWWPVLALALCWVLLQAAQLGWEYRRLAALAASQQAEMTSLFQQAFPERRRVPGQEQLLMERGLAELRGNGSPAAGLLPVLAQVGPLLTAAPGVRLRALRYRAEGLDVDLVLPDLPALDDIKQALAQGTGLTVEIVAAAAGNDSVEARLALRAPRANTGGGA